MWSLFRKQAPAAGRAIINGVAVEVQPKETLLLAALRARVDFPNNCRVGGCAACKCRLVEGRVHELTDTSYILSEDELAQGYILACQSQPLGEVVIDVAMQQAAKTTRVAGRVIAQHKLTHDITQLRLRLDQPLDYKPGQFANLALACLPNAVRAYSFATPPSPDGVVTFFIRYLPGGAFSSIVHQQPLVGEAVTLEGPDGEFWLRPADNPLLLMAGGSGLAPLLAMLAAALAGGCNRPVVFLFGARAQRDLYLLEDIQRIAHQWPARFNFVPVLSQEPANSDWTGARGLVTDMLDTLTLDGCHAYLCGPPAMIDAAQDRLLGLGVARDAIYADRFLSQAPTQPPAHLVSAEQE